MTGVPCPRHRPGRAPEAVDEVPRDHRALSQDAIGNLANEPAPPE